MQDRAQHWLQQILALPLEKPVRIMNVCGGHERAIAMAGLRSLLPSAVQLIPGPGCPVCICPEDDVHQAIQWALDQRVIVASFGDMLRVPVNVPRGEVNSLAAARAAGAEVHAIASPAEAVRIARENPERQVVFHAVGFETTMAPIAALIGQGLPANLLILASGRRTWPAVAMLLDSPDAGLDALIAPGHVATVMGPEEWAFVPQHYRLPAAIAGFTADSLLAEAEILHIAGDDDGATVSLRHAGQLRTIRCKLLVHAEGTPGDDPAVSVSDYDQHAVICEVTPTPGHNKRAWERFTPDGPLALLPLGDEYSIVFTLPPARADAVMALDDDDFLAALQARGQAGAVATVEDCREQAQGVDLARGVGAAQAGYVEAHDQAGQLGAHMQDRKSVV